MQKAVRTTRWFNIFVLAALLMVGTLGILFMDHNAVHGRCVYGFGVLRDCAAPEDRGLLFIESHLEALKRFSQVPESDLSSLAMVVFVSSIVWFGAWRSRQGSPPNISTITKLRRYVNALEDKVQKRLHHWLALHEMRDPEAVVAVRVYDRVLVCSI